MVKKQTLASVYNTAGDGRMMMEDERCRLKPSSIVFYTLQNKETVVAI